MGHHADAAANFEASTRRRSEAEQLWPFDPPHCPRDAQDGWQALAKTGLEADEEVENHLLGLMRDMRSMGDMNGGLRIVLAEVFALLRDRKLAEPAPVPPTCGGPRIRALVDMTETAR